MDTTTQLTPVFIIYLNDKRFSIDMESDVKEIKVERRIDRSSTFAITMADMGRKWTDHPEFTEGSKIKIMLGYKDAVEEVMHGEVTGTNPIFRKNSDERVIIRGQDVMHRLHRGKKTITFSNMTDKEIAEKIAADAGMGIECEEMGTVRELAVQSDQTDYEYLTEIGSRYNCRLITKDDKLLFKPIDDSSGEEIIMEWGKTLIEFHPELDSTRLVTETEVIGWDTVKGDGIEGTAGYEDISRTIGEGSVGGATVFDNYGDVKSVIVNREINDKNNAEKRAIESMTRNSMKYITGWGIVQGNNKIDAGMIVHVKEVGIIFSGEYFVTEVKHVFIAEQGYTTRFECERNITGKDSFSGRALH